MTQRMLSEETIVDPTNERGETPLHYACFFSRLDIARELIARNASLDAKEQNRYTPFHLAVVAALDTSHTDETLRVVQLCMENGSSWDEVCDSISNERGSRGASNFGIRTSLSHWMSQPNRQLPLVPMPVEVFRCGVEAAKEYDNTIQLSGSEALRRKVTVLGAAKSGKTAFIKALLPPGSKPRPQTNDGLGIEQFDVSFHEPRTSVRHDVSIWDFCGLETAQVAQSMFVTERTLFVVCVNFETYAIALLQAELIAENSKQRDEWMEDFVQTHIFRWIRMVHDNRPHAEIVLVGTKADKVHSSGAVSVEGIKNDLEKRLSQYARELGQWMQAEYRRHNAATRLGGIVAASLTLFHRASTLRAIANLKWISTGEDKETTRTQFERIVMESGRSFPVPDLLMRVLDHVTENARDAARSDSNARIHKTFMPVDKLRSELRAKIPDLEGHGDAMLKILHELGDVAWYHDLAGVAPRISATVIMDPSFLMGFAVNVLTHEHTPLLARTAEILPHGTLVRLRLWKEVNRNNDGLLLAIKQLLHHFNIIFPTKLEKKNPLTDKCSVAFGGDDLRLDSRVITSDEPFRVKWEYRFNGLLPDVLFDRFVIASYRQTYQREVGPDWTLHRTDQKSACRAVVGRDWITQSRFIRLEAVTATLPENLSDRKKIYNRLWAIFRTWVEGLERVIRDHKGITVEVFAMDADIPYVLRDAAEAAVADPEEYASWLPPDMEWYIRLHEESR